MRWSRTSSPRPASADRLLDPGLAWALRRLALPRRTARGPVEGAQPGSRGGPGEDFFQHRAYVPGEDLRQVDFRASARSVHVLVKELHRPLRQPLAVLVDLSPSMRLLGKERCARQLAVALGVLGLRRGDPFHLLGLERDRVRLAGRVLAAARPGLEAEALVQALPPGEPAELAAALAGPFPVSLKGAHLLVLSDCYGEPAALGRALKGLRGRAGAVTVLQVLAPEEARLPAGWEALEDVESGRRRPVDAAAAAALPERVAAWRAALRASVAGGSGDWVDVDASAPVARTLEAWLG